MTEVRFFDCGSASLACVCRLVAEAVQKKRKVAVMAESGEQGAALDRLLWTFQPLAFVPHCFALDRLADQTPVVLDHEGRFDNQHDDVLVNLSERELPFFSRFRYLYEIVGDDPAQRDRARERYRAYRSRGYPLSYHDLSAAEVVS